MQANAADDGFIGRGIVVGRGGNINKGDNAPDRLFLSSARLDSDAVWGFQTHDSVSTLKGHCVLPSLRGLHRSWGMPLLGYAIQISGVVVHV